MQIGFAGLVFLGAVAWGFARVLDAPRWVARAIPLVLIAVMLASQILLPAGAPLRDSVGAALRALVFLGLASLPVLGYRWLLRRLRARQGQGVQPRPSGFVLIDDDAALTAEADAAQSKPENWSPEAFSIAFRADDGAVRASAQAVVTLGLAEVRYLTFYPGAGADLDLGQRLLDALEGEARSRGATRMATDAYDWNNRQVFLQAGFTETGCLRYPGGATRITLTKELT